MTTSRIINKKHQNAYLSTITTALIAVFLAPSAFAEINIGSGNADVGIGTTATVIGNNNTTDKTLNGVMIGNNGTLLNSDNGIVIGNGSVTNGDGVSIGGGTTTGNGVAIGSGSVAGANEMNIGDRQLTGVLDGVADTDAVNVGQLNSTAEETLDTANTYTDSKATATVNEVQTYTDNRISSSLNSLFNDSKNYIDEKVKKLDEKIDDNYQKGNAGISGAMAMAGIPYKYGYEVSTGMAVSNYRGQQAIAVGAEWHFNDRGVTRFSTSVDTKGGVGAAAGFAFGFGSN